MIIMCPPVPLGNDAESRCEMLRKAAELESTTIATRVPEDWPDEKVVETREFLDEHGLRVGEYVQFRFDFASAVPEEHRAAMADYRRQLRHAGIVGAAFVGFNIVYDRATPRMWTQETWSRCIVAVGELASEAESAGTDVAVHPHYMSPLFSIERVEDLLASVPSARLKVLIDIVNLTSPEMVYRTTELVNNVFDRLGDRIVGLHAKDVTMSGGGNTIVHVDEAVPGTGLMDLATVLRRLDALGRDVTLQVEHLGYEDTLQGAGHIQKLAREAGIALG